MEQRFVYPKLVAILSQNQPQRERFIAKVASQYFVITFVVFGPKDTAEEDVFEVTFKDYEAYLPHMYKRWQE